MPTDFRTGLDEKQRAARAAPREDPLELPARRSDLPWTPGQIRWANFVTLIMGLSMALAGTALYMEQRRYGVFVNTVRQAEVRCGARSVSNALSRSIEVGPAYIALAQQEASYLGWTHGKQASWEAGKDVFALRSTKELLCIVVVREYMHDLENKTPDNERSWNDSELQMCLHMLHGLGATAGQRS